MGTTMRSRSVMGGALVALALALASVAWACTPGMLGTNWFCPNNTSCADPSLGTTQSFVAGVTRYSKAKGLQVTGSWDVRYITGTANHAACMSSTSYIAGSFNSIVNPGPWWGWSKVAVALPSATGTYSTCATYPAGAGNNPTNATESDTEFTIL